MTEHQFRVGMQVRLSPAGHDTFKLTSTYQRIKDAVAIITALHYEDTRARAHDSYASIKWQNIKTHYYMPPALYLAHIEPAGPPTSHEVW